MMREVLMFGSDFNSCEEVGEALLLLADKLDCVFVRVNTSQEGDHTTIELVEG